MITKKRVEDRLIEETYRAYRGLDDDCLLVLKKEFPRDPVRQAVIDQLLAERADEGDDRNG